MASLVREATKQIAALGGLENAVRNAADPKKITQIQNGLIGEVIMLNIVG